MKYYPAFIILVIVSCNSPDKRGILIGSRYHNEVLGWTMDVPEGWQALPEETVRSTADHGASQVSEATGADIDMSEMVYLLSFSKDQYNSFQSTAEPFDEEINGSWLDNHRSVKETIFETYRFRGIDMDTIGSTEKISGALFHVFTIDLYSPIGTRMLTQQIYARHIDGYSFAAILSYNNEEEGEIMRQALRSSRFEK